MVRTNGRSLRGQVDSQSCSQCGSTWVLGGEGILGSGASVQKTFLIMGGHSKVNVTLELLAIGSWDYELFKVSIDDALVFTSNVVGQYGGELVSSYCRDTPTPLRFSFIVIHNTTFLKMNITTTLNENAYNEAFGVKRVSLTPVDD